MVTCKIRSAIVLASRYLRKSTVTRRDPARRAWRIAYGTQRKIARDGWRRVSCKKTAIGEPFSKSRERCLNYVTAMQQNNAGGLNHT
jgi:hypothetical protein